MDANQQVDLQLIERIRARQPGAREELVRKYIPLVRHIARRHFARRMDFDDLVQEGLIGLLGAIEEYRPDRFRVRFSTFAYLCVLRKIYNVIKQSNGPKHRVLADAVSLQAHLHGEETRTFLELQEDEGQVDPQEIVENRFMARDLRKLLRDHLSPLEYTVLELLVQGYRSTDISRQLGVGPKVVDNARTRVKIKLRRILDRYGSLLDPRVPMQRGKGRRDLPQRGVG